jgi:hypothetical protein
MKKSKQFLQQLLQPEKEIFNNIIYKSVYEIPARVSI